MLLKFKICNMEVWTSLEKKIPLLKSFFCMFGELSGEEITWIRGVRCFCLKKYGTSRSVLFCGVLSWVDKDLMKVNFFGLVMENRKLQGVVFRQVQSWVSYIQAKFHNIYFANANICFLSRSVQCKSLNPRNMFKEKKYICSTNPSDKALQCLYLQGHCMLLWFGNIDLGIWSLYLEQGSLDRLVPLVEIKIPNTWKLPCNLAICPGN